MSAAGWGCAVEARYLAAAVVLLALVAIVKLCVALRRIEHENTALRIEVAQADSDLRREQLAHRERLHDARSALIGLVGGMTVLMRNASPDRRDLQRMITSEFDRLQALLDPNAPEPITDFELGKALEPVLLAHRLDNEDIRCDLDPIMVRGRPHATAAVLDNILRNVSDHAPGARVSIDMSTTDDESVVIRVVDDGPGIPHAECADVLRPGVRGSTALGAGSGLGLHSAASTMAKQHGYLHVDRRSVGGTLVTFSLPLSPTASAGLSAPRTIARLTEAS